MSADSQYSKLKMMRLIDYLLMDYSDTLTSSTMPLITEWVIQALWSKTSSIKESQVVASSSSIGLEPSSDRKTSEETRTNDK